MVIETVTEHGYWVEAKDLRVGDVFLGANGELSILTNAVRVEQEGGITVFNFSVEGNHNYFILAKDYEYGWTTRSTFVKNSQRRELSFPLSIIISVLRALSRRLPEQWR